MGDIKHFLFVNKNIIAGWGARTVVLLLAFVNTRLLIDCVGTEGLAAYSIVISLTPWLALMNLGLPVTVQNAISRLRGRNTDYILMRDQAFGTMLLVGVALSPISILIGWVTHRLLLTNYQFVSASTVMAVYLLIFIMGICQLLIQVMYAEHDALWPNIYPAFAPIWTTAILLIARYYKFDNFNLLLLLIGISNLLIPLHAAKRLEILRRLKFNFHAAAKQVIESKNQFYFATLATATLSVDYITMSRTLATQEIVNYNLTSRLFMTLMVIHGVLLATNWTPISDLIHASKKEEAKKKLNKVLKQGLTIGAGGGFIILATMDPIANLLTNGEIYNIPFVLGLTFWTYTMLRIWTDTYAMALQSCGMVSEINKFIPLQAFISAISQYLLGTEFGAPGIVSGLMLSFILTASWIIPRNFYKITKTK
jgi:O-antigen/teichoic acid export membrane protein